MTVREFAKQNDIAIVGKLKKDYFEYWDGRQIDTKRIPFYYDESGASFQKVKHRIH